MPRRGRRENHQWITRASVRGALVASLFSLSALAEEKEPADAPRALQTVSGGGSVDSSTPGGARADPLTATKSRLPS